MFFDYCDINAQTEKDAFALLRINEVSLKLSQACYFAALDIIISNYQVKGKQTDRYKTAFITHKGLIVYNVMFFGLCNASATF